MKKIILSFLMVVFTVTLGFCFEFMPADIVNFYVPEYYGKVYDTFVGKNEKTVIYIQDAHCDYTAQKNVVKILKTFVDDYNFKMVAVEGSSGDIDTGMLASYPDNEVKASVSDYFMSTGQISGAEYFSVNSGKKFFLVGVENKKLYVENVEDFRSAFAKYADIEATLASLDKSFAVLKQVLYNEKLKLLTDKIFDFKEGAITFSQYFDFLYELAKKEDIDLALYPNFFSLVKANDLKAKIEFESVDNERGRILAVLGNKLKNEKLAALIDKSLKFKQKELSYLEYYTYLKKSATEEKIEGVDNFYTYTKYIELLNQIDKVALELEQEDLIAALLKVLYSNKKQNKLFELDRNFIVLSDLFGLKIDRMDFLFYKSNKGDFKSKRFFKFMNAESSVRAYLPSKDSLKVLDDSVTVAESFYQTALKREDNFVDNLLEQMDLRNVKTSVLIGGGFHTEGVMAKLKKKNISFAVITPMTSEKEQAEIDAKYTAFVQGKKTSFMKFLEGKEKVQHKEALPGVIGASPFFGLPKDSSYVLALESVFLRGEDKAVDKARAEIFPVDFASKLLSYSLAKGQDPNEVIKEWKQNYEKQEGVLRDLIAELKITDAVVVDSVISQYLKGGDFLTKLFSRFNFNQPMGSDLFSELDKSQKFSFVNFADTEQSMVYHFFADQQAAIAKQLEAEVTGAEAIDKQGEVFESFVVDDFLAFLGKNIESFFGQDFFNINCKNKMSIMENSIGLSRKQRFDFFNSLVNYLEESIGVNSTQKWGLDINTVMETTDFKVIFDAYLKNEEASLVLFSDKKEDGAMKNELTAKLAEAGYEEAQIKNLMRKITFTKIASDTIDTVMATQQVNGLIISNSSVALKQAYIDKGVGNYLISEENTSLPVLFNVLSVVTKYNFSLNNLPAAIPQELKDLGIKNTEDLRNLFTSPFPVNVKATVLLDNLYFAREAVSRAA